MRLLDIRGILSKTREEYGNIHAVVLSPNGDLNIIDSFIDTKNGKPILVLDTCKDENCQENYLKQK